MAGRKRTKRKNSDEDFDFDEDGPDNDDVNRWACQSCTFMNRAAAYSCSVCGTRKGTSTRRSRVNDNVVEMQKTITTMAQKQVEKAKSMKRRERSMLTSSATRELSNGPAIEIKQELPFVEDVGSEKPTASPTTPVRSEIEKSKRSVSKTPVASAPASSKSSSPVVRTAFPAQNRVISPLNLERRKSDSPIIDVEETSPMDTAALFGKANVKMEPEEEPGHTSTQTTISASDAAPNSQETVGVTSGATMNMQAVQEPISFPSTSTAVKLDEQSILQHLPDRVVKKINQSLKADYNLVQAHKRITGIDPIVAEAETIVLPQNWDRQKVMKGLLSSLNGVPNVYVSPATSRQSSETDSSSSDANRSFEAAPNDVSACLSKSCQIPDYMIHRDSPQKIFIVANGYPAFFEEFPRRI